MRLIKPSFQLRTSPEVVRGINASLKDVGQTCYKSGDKQNQKTPDDFVAMLISLGHESVIEHEILSVRIICDRGVTHEIVRHRIASYAQESTRYCDYNKGEVEFIIPPWCVNVPEGTSGAGWDCDMQLSKAESLWVGTMLEVEAAYKALRAEGWSPQQARSVLPNSLKTEIVMTANLREWRHFFKLRCAKAAHPQMREIAYPLWDHFCDLMPIVFLPGLVDKLEGCKP